MAPLLVIIIDINRSVSLWHLLKTLVGLLRAGVMLMILTIVELLPATKIPVKVPTCCAVRRSVLVSGTKTVLLRPTVILLTVEDQQPLAQRVVVVVLAPQPLGMVLRRVLGQLLVARRARQLLAQRVVVVVLAPQPLGALPGRRLLLAEVVVVVLAAQSLGALPGQRLLLVLRLGLRPRYPVYALELILLQRVGLMMKAA